MNKLIQKNILKTLSRTLYKNGINLDSLTNIINNDLNLNLPIDHILKICRTTTYIEENNYTIKITENFTQTDEFKRILNDLYNNEYLLNIYKNEEVNKVILMVYRLICDLKVTNYSEISNHMKEIHEKALDIKQVAHYSKDLKKMNLVKICVNELNSNEKIIMPFKFDYFNKISKKRSNSNKENNENDFDNYHDNDEQEQEENIMSVKAEDIPLDSSIIPIINRKELNDKFTQNLLTKIDLDNSSVQYVDNMSLYNNILYNLLVNKDGLTLSDLCLFNGLVGREKSAVRLVQNLEKMTLIMHSSVRKGRIFEFVYRVNPNNLNLIDPFILFLADQFNKKKNTLTLGITNATSDIVLPAPNTNNYSSLDINNANTELTKFVQLNSDDYQAIINSVTNGAEYADINTKHQITINSGQKSNDLILDFFYRNIDKTGYKSFSDISFNRCLFCLNKINELKIISISELKDLIKNDLEKENKCVIDRKSLRKILIFLETLKLIQLLEFEVTLKNMKYLYFKNQEELHQIKYIAIKRNIEINNAIRQQCIEMIKPKQMSQNKKIIAKKIEKHQNLLNFSKNSNLTQNLTQNKISLHPVDIKVEEILNNFDLNVEKREIFIQKVADVFSRRQNFLLLKHKRTFFNKILIKVLMLKNLQSFFSNINNERNFNDDKPFYKFITEKKFNKIIVPSFLKKKIDRNNEKKQFPRNNFNLTLNNSNIEISQMITNVIQKGRNNDREIEEKELLFQNIDNQIKDIYQNSKLNDDDLNFMEKNLKCFEKNQKNEKNFKFEQNNDKNVFDIEKIRIEDPKKMIDLYSVLSLLYFNPNIQEKRLSQFNSTENLACFLNYFKKIGLLRFNVVNGRNYLNLDEDVDNCLDIV